MKTLIVGVGALGGLIAARMLAAGQQVCLATRNQEAADQLRELRMLGQPAVQPREIGPLEKFSDQSFDLILLATKAQDALEIAPRLKCSTLLPIQNGGVSQMLAERLGSCVLGGLSNLAATMICPGVYEQKNQGHLLLGELSGGLSERAQRVRNWLGRAVEVRITANLTGAIWSKLLLNCSVTTLGAITGGTMRDYIHLPEGRRLFEQVYGEALAVARATGATPERMLVDPLGSGEEWIEEVLAAYGDLKPSMLQDFERGRPTEIDFINGYVADLGERLGVPTPVNQAVVHVVRRISLGQLLAGRLLLHAL